MNRIFNVNNIEKIENRGENTPRTTKNSFIQYKDNTINSLRDIECFLNDVTKFVKCIKLYKILK